MPRRIVPPDPRSPEERNAATDQFYDTILRVGRAVRARGALALKKRRPRQRT